MTETFINWVLVNEMNEVYHSIAFSNIAEAVYFVNTNFATPSEYRDSELTLCEAILTELSDGTLKVLKCLDQINPYFY